MLRPKRKSFRVGPLEVDRINRVLGTELEAADVWVSKACHAHIAEDHPDAYPLIMANIIDIVREPTWVGQDPKHGNNFYLVRRIAVGPDQTEMVLVAIGFELSPHGTYSVRTGYLISEEDVTKRRLRGSLHNLRTT